MTGAKSLGSEQAARHLRRYFDKCSVTVRRCGGASLPFLRTVHGLGPAIAPHARLDADMVADPQADRRGSLFVRGDPKFVSYLGTGETAQAPDRITATCVGWETASDNL